MSKKGVILVVDDDNDDREMIIDIIKSSGIKNQILCFENGKLALDYLTSATDQPFLL